MTPTKLSGGIAADSMDGEAFAQVEDVMMRPVGVVNRAEQIIQRKDGSQVKIVAQGSYGFPDFKLHRDVFVLRKGGPEDKFEWNSVSKQPHPDWRSMSVDDYVKHGRPEMLQLVSHSEILSVAKHVGEPSAEPTLILPAIIEKEDAVAISFDGDGPGL